MTIIYRNQDGSVVTYPQQTFFESDNCPAYSCVDEALNIAVFEAMGKREKQEDRVCWGIVHAWEDLNLPQQMDLLFTTFANLHQQVADLHPFTGSTAVSSVIQKNNITTAWIGDSVAYLILFNDDGSLACFSPLHKNLHHPNPTTIEGQRVLKVSIDNQVSPPFEYSPGNWRLGDGLSLSRALGDKCSEPYGLIHIPEISAIHYSIPQGGYGLVLTACDGLTEALSAQELKTFINQQQENNPERLAKLLIDWALDENKGNSTDNVSIIVAMLNPLLPSRIVALFDGHNGSQVSQLLSTHFLSMLHENIRQVQKL